MPKPNEVIEKEDITDPIVDIRESKAIEKDEPGIEVDLEPKVSEKKEEPRYVSQEHFDKLQKQFNGISQTLRHVKDIPTQMAELQKVINSRFATNAQKQDAKDELDDMLEKGDWRTPVEKLAEKKFESMMKAREEHWQSEQAKAQKVGVLDASKRSVREKYPDIDDMDSEIARRYQKVISEKPHYLSNEYGPILAMRDMEDELRQEGRLDEFTKSVVEKEVARVTRTGASGVPRNPVAPSGNKIMLTKEQKAFCDSAGLKYEDYGKYARKVQTSPKEGVEL